MRTRYLVVPLLALALLIAAGCTPTTRVTFIPDGGSYTAKDLAPLLRNADPGNAAKIVYDDALSARDRSLISLRKQGKDASVLADILTSEFPADTHSVPFKAERVTFEGKDAWIVMESTGQAGGRLVSRRLWVISVDSRTVLAAESAR